MTYHYESISQELIRLRYLIGSILLVSLLIGIGLGSMLAVNIGQPIQQVTQAVYGLASGRRTEPLLEEGPEEVRQLQRAANYLVARLHNLEESRHKLLGNLVHELGRPLGALSAAIQALRRGAKEDPPLLEEFLQGMEHETDLLRRVTEDLSHLHGQVLGPLELEYKTIPLAEWLPLNLLVWQASAQEQRLRWETNIQDNLPSIQADPDRLAQALGNLISNAIKYTPTGGLISVSAGFKQGEVWVSVRDSGPGITPEEQEKIFTPFYRGGQGKRFPQGMGLGLSITRDMVTAHAGRIEVESAPGLGSTFTIWIPVKA